MINKVVRELVKRIDECALVCARAYVRACVRACDHLNVLAVCACVWREDSANWSVV